MDEASQHPPYSALVSSRAMTGSQFIVNDGSPPTGQRANEPVKDYAPGSSERIEIKAQLAQMLTERIDCRWLSVARMCAPDCWSRRSCHTITPMSSQTLT